MKLRDLLNVSDEDMFICVSIPVYGMQFQTKHSVGFFIENESELNDMEIEDLHVTDGDVLVKLKH